MHRHAQMSNRRPPPGRRTPRRKRSIVIQRKLSRPWSAALATVVLTLGVLVGLPGAAEAAGTGPCDIYGGAGTPCVAAHSTVRALYGAYAGNLYQVRRASDGATTNVGLLAAGGYANAAAQDSFCANTS